MANCVLHVFSCVFVIIVISNLVGSHFAHVSSSNSASASLEYSTIIFCSCFVNESRPAADCHLTCVFLCISMLFMIFNPFSLLGSVSILVLINFPKYLAVFVKALLDTFYDNDFNGNAKVLIFLRIWHLQLNFLAAAGCAGLSWLAGWLVGWLAGWLAFCWAVGLGVGCAGLG